MVMSTMPTKQRPITAKPRTHTHVGWPGLAATTSPNMKNPVAKMRLNNPACTHSYYTVRLKFTIIPLQKLCYYSQAWSLVWDEEPLFKEDIEAWAHGPVVPCLYKHHKGQFIISSLRKGRPGKLDDDQAETVDVVLKMYGDMPGVTLRSLTHRELPWREARRRGALGIR